MSRLLYFAFGFLIGATVGGVASYLYMDKKKKEVEDEFNDYLEYHNISDNYSEDDQDDEEINPQDNKVSDDDDEIKERLMEGYEKTTNYAAMYRGEAANYEHPMDDDEEESDDIYDVDATEEHRQNMNRPPKMISSEAVGDIPSYFDKETLLYYFDNDVLVNEENDELPDQETYVGDALTKYGFKERDEEETIYVLNYALDTLYTVQKVFDTYSTE